ncbi:hypothetical protein [Streptomyces chrestomyceticus]|uniref:hypothetical protein n=1 Tax=Streptomyces chrestomyceticus TaxID=68185 RepID=UPI0035A8FFF7
MDELVHNLWPKDCQTCGWSLGASPPTVLAEDIGVFVVASLHHARCQPARWATNSLHSTNQPLCSYTVKTLLLPMEKPDGSRDDRPLMIVNPSLEAIALQRTGDGWAAVTVPHYRRLGLRTAGQDLVVDQPLADMSATLEVNEVTVTLDDTGEQWSCGCTSDVARRVQELQGITLGITTAADPSKVETALDLGSLIHSGRLVAGWVAFTGSQGGQPLQEMGAPESLRTFILHWGTGHASVGELLSTTDRALSTCEAKAWAIGRLSLPEGRLLPWREVRRDSHAWYATDPLSVETYFIRQHTDAWKLIKVCSRMEGVDGLDEDGAKDWATRAVRLLGESRIISWVTGPSTDSGFRTLHGSSVPR